MREKEREREKDKEEVERGQRPSERQEERPRKDDHIPEDTVSILIRLPHFNQSIISLDRLLHNEPLAIKLPHLPRNSLDLHLPLLSTLLYILVLDGNLTRLHGGAETTGSVEGGNTGSPCAAALGEGALGGEFEGDLAVEVEGFEVLLYQRVLVGVEERKKEGWRLVRPRVRRENR